MLGKAIDVSVRQLLCTVRNPRAIGNSQWPTPHKHAERRLLPTLAVSAFSPRLGLGCLVIRQRPAFGNMASSFRANTPTRRLQCSTLWCRSRSRIQTTPNPTPAARVQIENVEIDTDQLANRAQQLKKTCSGSSFERSTLWQTTSNNSRTTSCAWHLAVQTSSTAAPSMPQRFCRETYPLKRDSFLQRRLRTFLGPWRVL